MRANFKFILDTVTAPWEGGKVDHPRDPGGRTNRGVIQRVYDAFRTRKGFTKRDVYDMSEDEYQEIYKTQYWDVNQLDLIPTGADAVVFDYGVNSGPSRAAKAAQTVISATVDIGKVDGAIGNRTLAGFVTVCADNDKSISFVKTYNVKRAAFVRGLSIYSTFGRGWENRIADVTARAVAMVLNAAGVAPGARLGQEAARAEQTAREANGAAGTATAAGASTGTAGGAVAVPDAIQTGDWRFVAVVVAVFVVTGIAVAIYKRRNKYQSALASAFKREVIANPIIGKETE